MFWSLTLNFSFDNIICTFSCPPCTTIALASRGLTSATGTPSRSAMSSTVSISEEMEISAKRRKKKLQQKSKCSLEDSNEDALLNVKN